MHLKFFTNFLKTHFYIFAFMQYFVVLSSHLHHLLIAVQLCVKNAFTLLLVL